MINAFYLYRLQNKDIIREKQNNSPPPPKNAHFHFHLIICPIYSKYNQQQSESASLYTTCCINTSLLIFFCACLYIYTTELWYYTICAHIFMLLMKSTLYVNPSRRLLRIKQPPHVCIYTLPEFFISRRRRRCYSRRHQYQHHHHHTLLPPPPPPPPPYNHRYHKIDDDMRMKYICMWWKHIYCATS